MPSLVELLMQERGEFRDRPKPTYFEHRDANRAKWETLLRGLIGDGRLRAIPVDTIMNVMGDLLYGTMFTNYFAGSQRSQEQQAEEIVQVVLLGLLSDTERAKRAGRAPGAGQRV